MSELVSLVVRSFVPLFVRACVHVCARGYVRACVRACVRILAILLNCLFVTDNRSYIPVSSSGTWIGGRRYTTEVYDFVWVYTNTSVHDSGYTHWKSGEPTDPRSSTDPADCMRLKSGNMWYDSRCSRYFDILCEI